MPAKLSTLENALMFRYVGDDRLYTDHDGQRVIVDVEGFGIIRLIASDSPVLTIRGGGAPEEFLPTFFNGAIVLALHSGEVKVQVLKGRLGPVQGEQIEAKGTYFGAGWVVGATSDFTVDDRHEVAPSPSSEFPVPFFRTVTGNGNWLIVPDESVQCKLVDSFSIGDELLLKQRDFKVQNISAISALNSTLADGAIRLASLACHLNAASFTVAIPKNNLGLILRKTYDRFHGRQRARVFVDDVFAGWWYEAGENRTSRWHVSDFGVEEALTAGKPIIRVTIDPPAGVALWSVSAYDIFALVPKVN
jgi:hypothetical protein